MAVKIRLKRMGKKKQPFYRIVVADSRAPRDGRSIEKIGHYNPITDPAELVIDEERLFHWMDEGAKPSDTVFSLLRGRGLTLKYELLRRNADEATISKEMHKWELARDERGKKQAAQANAEMAAAEVVEEVEEVPVVEETVVAEEVVEAPVAEVAVAEEVEETPAVVEEVATVEEPVEEPTESTETEDSK